MSHTQEYPHDLLAEKSFLGCLMIDSHAYDEVFDLKLKKDDFYHPQYRIIFEAIHDLYEAKAPIDYVSVSSKLLSLGKLDSLGEEGIRGPFFIANLIEEQASAANVQYYGKIVKEKSKMRTLIKTAQQIYEQGLTYSGDATFFISEVEAQFFKLTQDMRGGGMKKLSSFLLQNLRDLEDKSRKSGEMSGLSTGFTEIDRKLLGLQPGQLVIIAARPGMGKTALAINMAMNVVKKHNLPIAVFSLEMLAPELSMRIISGEARVDSKKMRTKSYNDQEIKSMGRQVEKISQYPIYVNDNGYCTVLDIQSECRKIKAELGLGLVIVDYIQLMRSHTNNPSREQQISEISRCLKQLAKELECPILALSQLNRAVESRQDKRPTIADLRESGSLEQDADIILLIYRDEMSEQNSAEKGIAEIIVGKNRAGETGVAKLKWFGEYTSFANLEQHGRDVSQY